MDGGRTTEVDSRSRPAGDDILMKRDVGSVRHRNNVLFYGLTVLLPVPALWFR
ncbi:hypothetical protein J7E73_11275 [Paenibacillus albidus]|uniref:hypothetical protein n=1 Tax=Paenibacillus albidus TaxID=2041023 RepID=UPI001BE89CB5|nr:hypothetical protein [Paenibacillus albidus]MBT2289706.1 hypothetical protein [Paenibacillus albidus]